MYRRRRRNAFGDAGSAAGHGRYANRCTQLLQRSALPLWRPCNFVYGLVSCGGSGTACSQNESGFPSFCNMASPPVVHWSFPGPVPSLLSSLADRYIFVVSRKVAKSGITLAFQIETSKILGDRQSSLGRSGCMTSIESSMSRRNAWQSTNPEKPESMSDP